MEPQKRRRKNARTLHVFSNAEVTKLRVWLSMHYLSAIGAHERTARIVDAADLEIKHRQLLYWRHHMATIEHLIFCVKERADIERWEAATELMPTLNKRHRRKYAEA